MTFLHSSVEETLRNLKEAKDSLQLHPSIDPTVRAIEVSGVSMTFKKKKRKPGSFRSTTEYKQALKDINLHIHKGEIYGLLGTNGSGKSTLIRVISTLLLPTEGEVKVYGMDVEKHHSTVRKMISRVSVDAAFYKKLSAKENLLYSARLYGLDLKEAEKRAKQVLKKLGLKEETYLEPLEDMSRGMQQKIAIARAFLQSPDIVLLDEPSTGLDPKSRKDVQRFVTELRERYQATIILTTHDMAEADTLCDRIAFIKDGAIVVEDTPEGLKKRGGPDATLEDVFIEMTGQDLNADENG